MTRLTISFILLLSFSFGFSQEEVNYSNLRSLRDGEFFIRFQVMDLTESKKVKFDRDAVYHWFKSQKVMSTQGGASGVLLDGIYEEFFPNSQLKVKGYFKKGVKHGEWMYWNDSGQLVKEVQWRRGKRVKDAIKYNGKGEIISKKDFSANQKVYYEDDKIIKTWKDSTEVEVIHKYENGQTKLIERYENGQLEGRQLKYSSEGDLIYLENYKNGKLHGKQIDEEGNKTYFKNGEPHTPILKRLFEKKEKEKSDDLEKEKKPKKKKDQEKKEQDEK